MKKRVLIVISALLLLCAAGAIYINAVILPAKINSLILQSIQDSTHKKAKLSSLKFNLFKGIIIKNLVIYDESHEFISLKECSFNILIPPLFFKKVIIPAVKLDSLSIFLQRNPDNSLDILELLPKASTQASGARKNNFSFFIYKIIIVDSAVHFKDKALPVEFNKSIDNLRIVLRLSLPASLKFDAGFEIPGASLAAFTFKGEYKISQNEFWAKVLLKGLSPLDFAAYYQGLGVSVKQGVIDGGLNLKFKDNQLKFSGAADLDKLDITGVEFLGAIDNVKGKLNFDNASLSADKLSAQVFKIPVAIKFSLEDFKNPFLKLALSVDAMPLAQAKAILKDKLNFDFPGEIEGEGNLALKIESRLPPQGALPLSANLDIFNSRLKLEKLEAPFENIRAKFDFFAGQLKWRDLAFTYLDTEYKSEGVLDNFQSPRVQLKLSSVDLLIDSDLNITGKSLKFSRIEGKYLNSDFLVKGDADMANFPALPVNLALEANLDLEGLNQVFKKYKDRMGLIKPLGIVNVKIRLNGDASNIKDMALEAKLSSFSLSAYGLKSGEFTMEYNQQGGIADIPAFILALYDGKMEANAKINLASENQPYLINAKINDIKLEKLKLDTQVRDKDISGSLSGEVKINGTIKDPLGISGIGRIVVLEGKLWELNLFQGLGKILFAKDFANINIKDGSCDFTIQDKSIFSDNLKMAGDLIDLSGAMRVGFNGAIDSSLNAHINDEMAPISGTFKDVATAILGQAGRFGTIKISGSLEQPKYKFQPSAVDMLKALKDALFGG